MVENTRVGATFYRMLYLKDCSGCAWGDGRTLCHRIPLQPGQKVFIMRQLQV